MRLAYQDLSQLKKKEEEKLRNVDPKKAQQLERLGMGFASKRFVDRPCSFCFSLFYTSARTKIMPYTMSKI